jgi:hypothetical protein
MKKKIDTRPKVPFYIDEEPTVNKSKIALFMRMRDKELDREPSYIQNNQCPHCHIALATNGDCSNGCGYHSDHISFKITKKKKGEKQMNNLQKANKIMELMESEGLSLEQAINKVLEKRTEERIAKEVITTWTYQGDLRCPECNRYSKVFTTGSKYSKSYRLDCPRHGSFYKTPEHQYWRSKAEIAEVTESIAE